jgi:hypothetical protein
MSRNLQDRHFRTSVSQSRADIRAADTARKVTSLRRLPEKSSEEWSLVPQIQHGKLRRLPEKSSEEYSNDPLEVFRFLLIVFIALFLS